MTAKIHVLTMWAKNHIGKKISTISKHSALSPFLAGPVTLWDGTISKNMENAWQFSKVYKEHTTETGDPSEEWFAWSKTGWDDSYAHRYPMGKGRKPEYAFWKKQRLGYVESRKAIYAPLYIQAIKDTAEYKNLVELAQTETAITLLDYDAYDHHAKGMSLTDVLNDPKRKMGHAFVLAMMLTNDPALQQLELT